VIKGAERHVQKMFPQLRTSKYPNLLEKLTFIHAEDILDMYLIYQERLGRRRYCKSIQPFLFMELVILLKMDIPMN